MIETVIYGNLITDNAKKNVLVDSLEVLFITEDDVDYVISKIFKVGHLIVTNAFIIRILIN